MSSKVIQIESKSLRKSLIHEFPRIKSITTSTFNSTETLVVVSDSLTSYVDEKGVLHLHPSTFPSFERHIFDFFTDFKSNGSLKEASKSLIKKIEGDNYGS